MGNNILVTGGAGYIGSHACKALAKAGYTPIAYDSLVYGHRDAVRWGPLVEGDLADQKLLADTLARFEVTAVIHFAVAGQHFQEYWLYGVFMLVVAWLQLLWAAAAIARPSRLLLACGVILNVAVVAVYIVTRTAGDVIGPGASSPEQAGFGDVLCTVLEAIVAAGCAWLLIARTDSPAARSWPTKAWPTTPLFTA